jgi:hypothetical protein
MPKDRMFTDGFWTDFWPNFVSTLIGVGLGVPVALQLNRLNVTHADRVRVAAETARVLEALTSMRRSLEGNLSRLQALLKERERGGLSYPLTLDVSTWDVLGVQLAGTIKDPVLLSRLAHHYDRLEQLRRLNERLFDVVAGVASTLTSAETVKQALANEYTNEARELKVDCEGLLDKVSIASQRLVPGTA